MSIANALFDYFQSEINKAPAGSSLYEADLIQSIYTPIKNKKSVRLLDAFSMEFEIAKQFEIFETNYLTGIQVVQIPNGKSAMDLLEARAETVLMVKEVVRLLCKKDILNEYINKVQTLKAKADWALVQSVSTPYIEQALIINEF